MSRSLQQEDLVRAMPFTLTRADADTGDGLTMEGDAAVFNTPVVIDSWEGRFKEILVPGAFKKTLRENTPRLQFDHGTHPLIGSIPIGRLTEAYEDGTRAVHVVARLSDNWLVQPVREAIADGAIDGMSFRFSIIREEWRDADNKLLKPEQVLDRLWESDDVPESELMVRSIKELRCPELGPVVFPAYTDTSVGVRSITIDLGRLDRPEQRAALARAVMLADLAEKNSDEDEVDAPPEGHPESRTSESTDAPPVEGHPSDAEQDPFAATAQRMASVMSRIKERSNKT